MNQDTVRSRLRDLRQGRGISQQALAQRAGLSRQTVNAIEGGRSAPAVAVALRLARALDCRVEDLFSLPDAHFVATVELAAEAPPGASRVALAKVRGRTVAHTLSGEHALQEGFTSAGGLLAPGSSPHQARLLVPLEQLEHSGLLLGCDPSLGLLCARVAQHSPATRLLWLSASSRGALAALARGEAHAAGSHLQTAAGRDDNVTPARQALARVGALVIGFARWEQGLAVPPGNPKSVRSVADLARADVRIVNREPGSGARALLDRLLRQAGLDPHLVQGYEVPAVSHLAVARAVASGRADAGIALHAAAQVFGLDFVPLSDTRFDLVVPHDLLDHPAVSVMLDVLQSRDLRDELGALPGYDVSETGEVVADLPAA